MRHSTNLKLLAAGVTLACGVATAPTLAAGAADTRPAAAPGVASTGAMERSGLVERVSGTWTDADGAQGKVRGTLTPTSFEVSEDGQQLLMTAELVLRATGKGAPKGAVTETITTPVQDATASGRGAPGFVGASTAAAAPVPSGCSILSLDLGPLNLDLLGLVVVLQPVVLDIVAVPGAGNLLGNLLCAVAGLLDGVGLIPGLLQQIADLLNQIIAAISRGTPA